MLKRKLIIYGCILLLAACTTAKESTSLQYKGYRITSSNKQDTAMLRMLAPYADSIHKTMFKVIGFSTKGLSKRQPEGELGNFMADCMHDMAEQKLGIKVDAAFINYGGIRSYIPKGEITVGKIYELMPFDNLIVVQQIKGVVLKQFLARVAEKGGWPVSSGFKMQVKEKKAFNITIQGKPIEDDALYNIANSDYVANGGDECDMLRNVPQVNKGLIFRDALIDYIQQLSKQGKPIDWSIDGRVTY